MLFGKLKEKVYWILAVLLVLQALVMIWMVLKHYESFKQQMTPFVEDSLQACLPKKQVIAYLSNHYLYLNNIHHNYVNRVKTKHAVKLQYVEAYSDLEACLEQLFLLPIPLTSIKMEAREDGMLLSLVLDT